MSIEAFANQPTGTVTSGGTTTGSTSFTVTATNAFPVASTSTIPATTFSIMDPALPTEIMTVTTAPGGTGAGQAWTVARAQEGTSAVAHAANWTCVQVVSAGSLQGFKQATGAGTSAVTLNTSVTETVIATHQPVAPDLIAGTSWEAVAFGTWTKALGVALPTLTWRLRWGGLAGTVLASLVTGTTAPAFLTTVAASGLTWDVNGTVTYLSATSAVANLNWWFQNSANITAGTIPSSAVTALGPTTISGNGPLVLTAQWSVNAALNSIVAMAPLIYRAA